MKVLKWVIILILFLGCNNHAYNEYHLTKKNFNMKELDKISKLTKIHFPKNSSGINMYYNGKNLDPSFIAKIELPIIEKEFIKEQLQNFIENPGTVEGSLSTKVDWWNPNQLIVVFSRQYLEDGNYVKAILCQKNDSCILFVEWIKI